MTPSARRSRVLPRLVAGALTIASILIAMENLRVHLPNRDVSWLLYLGQHLLGGARLNVDLFEIDPPFVVWLNTGAVWVANMLRADPVAVYDGCVALLLAFGTVVTVYLARLSRWEILVLTVALWLLPGGEFGQREHLMVALLFPYAGLLSRRCNGRAPAPWQAVTAGVLAGLGLCLKPHFVLVWAAMEAAVWRGGTRWWRRTELLSVAIIQVAYWIAVSSNIRAYLAVLRAFGPAYNAFWHVSPASLVMFEPSTSLVVAALALAAIHYRATPVAVRAFLRILGALTAASYVVALIQAKGWPYHFYPAAAFGLVLLFTTAAGHLSGMCRRTAMGAIAGGLALGLSVGVTFGAAVDEVVRLWQPSPGVRLVSAVRQASHPGERVVVFNFGMQPAFPTIPLARLESASRWPTQWILMAAYPTRQAWRAPGWMRGAERSLFASTVQDLTRDPPALLVAPVPDADAIPLRGFDFLGYFAQDESFARLLRRYDVVTTVSGHRILRYRDAEWHPHPPSLPPDLGGTIDEVLAGPVPPTRSRTWQLFLAGIVVGATASLWPRSQDEPTRLVSS